MTGLGQAVRYLTIVPVPGPRMPVTAAQSREDLGRAGPWFPVVGLGLGLGLALVQSGATRLFSPLLAALLTVTAWKLATGGLHLDGLADCLDGLAGRDPEHRLAIMRDSRIGAFAAIGLVLVLLLDVAALAEMAEDRRWRVLVLAPTVARATPLVLARLYRPARGDGHGASFGEGVAASAPWLAVGLALLVAVSLLGWAGLIAALAGLAAALLVGSLLARRLAGITGDVLGAAVEAAELAVLLAGAAWTPPQP